MQPLDAYEARLQEDELAKAHKARLVQAFGEVDYELAMLFSEAPVTLAPHTLWPLKQWEVK